MPLQRAASDKAILPPTSSMARTSSVKIQAAWSDQPDIPPTKREGWLIKNHHGAPLAKGKLRRYFLSDGFHVEYFETELMRKRTGRFDLRNVIGMRASTDPDVKHGIDLLLSEVPSGKLTKTVTVSYEELSPSEGSAWSTLWASALVDANHVDDSLRGLRDKALARHLNQICWSQGAMLSTLRREMSSAGQRLSATHTPRAPEIEPERRRSTKVLAALSPPTLEDSSAPLACVVAPTSPQTKWLGGLVPSLSIENAFDSQPGTPRASTESPTPTKVLASLAQLEAGDRALSTPVGSCAPPPADDTAASLPSGSPSPKRGRRSVGVPKCRPRWYAIGGRKRATSAGPAPRPDERTPPPAAHHRHRRLSLDDVRRMHRRQTAGVGGTGGTGGAGVPSSLATEHMAHGGILKAPSDMAHEVHARADSTLSSNPSIPRTPTSMPSMAKTPQQPVDDDVFDFDELLGRQSSASDAPTPPSMERRSSSKSTVGPSPGAGPEDSPYASPPSRSRPTLVERRQSSGLGALVGAIGAEPDEREAERAHRRYTRPRMGSVTSLSIPGIERPAEDLGAGRMRVAVPDGLEAGEEMIAVCADGARMPLRLPEGGDGRQHRALVFFKDMPKLIWSFPAEE